jgi:hypothetical protein
VTQKDERREVCDGLRRMLDKFDAENREPDRWEEVHLACTLDYLERGAIAMALAELQIAQYPVAERSEKELQRLNGRTHQFTKAQLRDRFLMGG